MRKALFTSVLILVLALTFYGGEARAQEPEVVWRGGQPIAHCPHCGKPMGPMGVWFGRGPGIMGRAMMGPTMMFEAEILTKNNVLVDKIMVDKQTAWTRSVY